MVDLFRQQLDELMGKERNVPLNDRYRKKEHFDDPDVCKYYLASFCPHDLFPNTKCDLGPCAKRHDEHFKKAFQNDPEKVKYERKYLNEMIGLIEGLLAGVETRIKKASNKVDPVMEVEKPKEIVERLDAMDNEIKLLLATVEKLGDEGKIEESELIMEQVDVLKKKKEELTLLGDASAGGSGKNMKVCDVCGALQAISDDRRSQTHLEGKLHTGFALLRKELEILKARKEEIRHEALKKNNTKKDTDKERESSRDRHNKKRRSRSRDHDRDRHARRNHKRHRSRSRSRSKSRSDSGDMRGRRKHERKHSRRHRSRSSSSSRSKSSSEHSRHKKSKRNSSSNGNKSHNDKDSSKTKDTQTKPQASTNPTQIDVPKELDRERGSDRRSDRSLYY